jgi:multiple sugar transport system permease protein
MTTANAGAPRRVRRLRPPRRDLQPIGHRRGPLEGNRLLPYLFSGPSIVLVSAVLVFPVLYGVYKSLYRAEFFGGPEEFVGLSNYVEMVKDPDFLNAFEKTALFVGGCVLLGTVLGLFFAFALNSVVNRLRFFRAVSIAPYLLSSVAAAVMFRMLFNSEFGLVNKGVEVFGVDGLRWLADPKLAMVVVIVAQVWSDLPLTILLLLGGLQSLNSEHLDAALVDGANGWQRAWHISIPLIMPQLIISTIWMSYSTLTGLGTILALTGGGPLKATQTLPLEMYEVAFDRLQINEALAIATFLGMLNILLTIAYVAFGRRYNLDDR